MDEEHDMIIQLRHCCQLEYSLNSPAFRRISPGITFDDQNYIRIIFLSRTKDKDPRSRGTESWPPVGPCFKTSHVMTPSLGLRQMPPNNNSSLFTTKDKE
ncbi:hypothetical protein TNCV_2433401 [Trichonephila clavipes]|nr:hypothetical protein TNCV_2433401 [Trichonephila clavipes]